MDKSDFLYPIGRYHGREKPENLVFNANAQRADNRARTLVLAGFAQLSHTSLMHNQSPTQSDE